MSVVRSNPTMMPLGEVGRWYGGGTPSKANPAFWENGTIPWVSPKDMKTARIVSAQDMITEQAIQKSATSLVEKGSVLVVVRSGILKHTLPIAVTEREVALNQDLKAVTPNVRIRSDYLALALKAFEQDILQTCTKNGTTVQNLSMPAFLRFAIPVPDSTDRQKEIVAEIEKQFTRLEAGAAALRAVQAKLKRYRAAVLKAACEGKLVENEVQLAKTEGRKVEIAEELLQRILEGRQKNWVGRGKYKEPAVPNTANLPPLPEGWTWVNVDQLLRAPLCNGISIKGSDNPPGVRALRLSAMSDSGFDYSDVRYLPLSESDVDDLWIEKGDFFMSRGNGSLHLVGRGTSAQKPPHLTIFPDTMIRIRLTNVVRESAWIRMLWPSHIVRSQIETRVKTTAGIYKIAQPQVQEMVLPFPPLAEQKRIVAEVDRRMSLLEGIANCVEANLIRATRLRQALLTQAFSINTSNEN